MKLIYDTDIGWMNDDCIAALFALHSPRIELLGITPVMGNYDLKLEVAAALRLTEFAGRQDNPESEDSAAAGSEGSAGNRIHFEVDTKTPFKQLKQELISEFERRYITELLDEHDHNISSAARAAGIDRMSIHKMLNRLGLSVGKH